MILGDGEKVRELCRRIEEEKDPHKFSELVKTLNDLLDSESSATESEPKQRK